MGDHFDVRSFWIISKKREHNVAGSIRKKGCNYPMSHSFISIFGGCLLLISHRLLKMSFFFFPPQFSTACWVETPTCGVAFDDGWKSLMIVTNVFVLWRNNLGVVLLRNWRATLEIWHVRNVRKKNLALSPEGHINIMLCFFFLFFFLTQTSNHECSCGTCLFLSSFLFFQQKFYGTAEFNSPFECLHKDAFSN